MNLIHKTNFNIITFTSSVPLKDYALISDELVNEIKSKFYDTGILDEFSNPILIDLNLVTKVNCSEIEGKLYSNCNSVVYKDRQTAIDLYENTNINNSYYGFAYKVEVYDFQAAIAYKVTDVSGNISQPFNEYAQVVLNTLVPKNAKVVYEDIFINPPTLQIRTKAYVYVNFLNVSVLGSMVTAQTLADDGVTMVDIITNIDPNPVFEVFNPINEFEVEVLIE